MARRLEGSVAMGASFGGVAAGAGVVTHMYLAQDADGASDANDGSQLFPLLTMGEVLRRLNRMVRIDSPGRRFSRRKAALTEDAYAVCAVESPGVSPCRRWSSSLRSSRS